MKNKLVAFLVAAALCGVAAVSVTGFSASAATPKEEYVPAFETVKSDTFEGLSAPAAGGETQFIYDKTALFFVEGNTATVVNRVAEPSNVLSGDVSLKWKPGFDWTPSSRVLGISPSKITGTEGGFLVKLSFLVKTQNISNLVIKALDSGGALRQETVLDASYNVVAGSVSPLPDTVVNVEKRNDPTRGDYCAVEFTFRGSVKLTPYFNFVAQGDSEDAVVYLDDVKVAREIKPNLPYVNYETFTAEGFEQATGLGDKLKGSIFSAFSNADAARSGATKDVSKVIQGGTSLIAYAPDKTLNIATVYRTDGIALKADKSYKLYYRFAYDRVKSLGVLVKKTSDNSIVYDLNFDLTLGERAPIVTNILLDSSNFFNSSNGIFTAYGEFAPAADMSVYLEFNFTSTHRNGYAVIDDVNLLKSFVPEKRPTVMPEGPVAPTGRVDAVYEDLFGAGLSFAGAVKNLTGVAMTDSGAIAFTAAAVLCLGLLLAAAVVYIKGSKKRRTGLKGIFLSMVLLSTFALSTACGTKGGQNSATPTPSGYNVVYPQKVSGKLDNPGMGWVSFEEPTYGGHVDLGASGELPEVDNISLSTSWAHIEVEEGVYDFSVIDRTIDYWTGLGKHINLRICTDTLMLPYTYKGVPDWLIEKYNVGFEMVDYLDPGPVRTHKVIDIRDKNYLEYLDKFLAALCEKYRDNWMVDVVEIRGFGVWGEWHHGHSFDSMTDRMLSLETILEKYTAAFEGAGKTLAVSAAWDPDFTSTGEYENTENPYMSYVDWSAFDKAWRMPGTTFRRDSGAALLRYDLDEKILSEAFRSGKRVPLLGEYATGYANLTDPHGAFNLMDGINDILYKMRPNYSTVLGWVNLEIAGIIAKGDTEFIDRGNEKLGYRLALDRARYPSRVAPEKVFSVTTSWSNTSVGIFPYKAPLEYTLIAADGSTAATMRDNNFDARTFVQGEINNVYSTLVFPGTVADGTYKLAVSLPLENGTRIALGMAGETAQNSRIYALGNIAVKKGATTSADSAEHTTFDKKDDFQFEANRTYEVTFRYSPKFDMKNFYFDQNNGYEFYLDTVSGGAAERVGFYKWQDISGEIGQKTVRFTTKNHTDYKLNISSDNFDAITVDDLWIEKVGGKHEGFDSYDFTDPKTILQPINVTTATVYPEAGGMGEAIDGAGSILLTSGLSKGKSALAKIDVSNYKLTKNKTYTVSFDFKALGNVSNGGYYCIGTGDYNKITRKNSEYETIGEWYERDDTFVTKKSFTFTAAADNQTLVFGMQNGGSYLIDNLDITEYASGKNLSGTDLGYQHNVIPTFDLGFGKTETFESASFASSGFEWGQFAWGRMTVNPSEVVNFNAASNKVSLLGRVESDAYNPATDNVWFEFARTKRKYYPFEANKTYNVSFDYKILKTFGSGKSFVFFRDDTIDDRFGEAVNDPVGGSGDLTTGKGADTVYHYSANFVLKNHANYQFMICMNGLWEIALDNVVFTPVD